MNAENYYLMRRQRSPIGTAEFSRGRQATEYQRNTGSSRVAAVEVKPIQFCRRYAAIHGFANSIRGLAPTAKFCRCYAAIVLTGFANES